MKIIICYKANVQHLSRQDTSPLCFYILSKYAFLAGNPWSSHLLLITLQDQSQFLYWSFQIGHLICLPGGESNPGLPGDRWGYSPPYSCDMNMKKFNSKMTIIFHATQM